MSDYDVGYGKPPQHSQFKKGRSGNPAGRPPKLKGMSNCIYTALHEKRLVKVNGDMREITTMEAMLRVFCNKAAKGDVSAIRALNKCIRDVPKDESKIRLIYRDHDGNYFDHDGYSLDNDGNYTG